MPMNIDTLTKDEVHELLNKDDAEISKHINSIAHPADISEFFRQLPIKVWPRLLRLVKDDINNVGQLFGVGWEVLTVLLVDEVRQLVGTLALITLSLNKANTRVAKIMDRNLVFVKPLLDQKKVAAIFKKYDLLSIPVV